MKIAIWGNGPAGMLAAHAARLNGHEFEMFGLGQKSPLYGAQYLHERIPEIPLRNMAMLFHEFRGDIEGYKQKVYDKEEVDSVSPEQFQGSQLIYDIREMYDWLCLEYAIRVKEHPIKPGALMGIDRNDSWTMTRWNDSFDMIVSTIPRKRICANPEHKFVEAKVWALGEAPELGITSPVQPGPDPENVLICSGSPADSWYRLSRIFGRTTVEWPGMRNKPPIRGIVEVRKPVWTSCNCWPEVLKIGRFGEWRKGVLTHHVFQGMMDLLG